MRYIYIHGFNSGPESRSGAALERLLGKSVARAANDYSQPFQECLERLAAFIEQTVTGEPVCLLGTSLGGFYALQLRLANIKKIAAWNPVIFPSLQLAGFVGENTRFTDQTKWDFSRKALLSYAAAPDPRVWRNFGWNPETGGAETPSREIFLGTHDEVLDHEVSAAYWAGHAPVHLIESGHSIESFEHSLPFID